LDRANSKSQDYVVSYWIGNDRKGGSTAQLLLALGMSINVTNTALRPDMGKFSL
jgi:hypothetical protein